MKVGHTSEFPFGIYWLTLKNLKNQKFEKMKQKLMGISSFYICVPKTKIIWDTVPGIQSETEFFCNFRPFFALSASKMKISKKMRKTQVDINILHKCMRDHDHKLHCSWDMVHDTWNCYFSFWVSFLPFCPTDSPKNQNFKKKKKTPGDIIILHMWIKNYD